MAGTTLKFWKVFSNVSNTKSVLTNKCLQPVHQSIASVKQSSDQIPNLPEKPKRPLTSYLTFYQAIFPKLVEKNPDSKMKDLARLAGQEWKNLDPSTKSKFDESAKKNLAEYRITLESYETQLTPAMREELKKIKEDQKKAASKRKQRKDKIELGAPTRPENPWIQFVRSKVADKGDVDLKDWVREVSKEYYLLDPKIKTNKEQQYNAALVKYNAELDKWEEEMIRQGRVDLVRKKAQIKNETKKSIKAKSRNPSASKKSKKSVKVAKK